MATDRSRAGRIARNRGKTWEREVANYMKQWFPSAHRRGYDQAGNAVRAAGEQTPDVAGTPYWIECKSRSGKATGSDIYKWWQEMGETFADKILFVKDAGNYAVFMMTYNPTMLSCLTLDEFAIYMDFEQYLEEGDK